MKNFFAVLSRPEDPLFRENWGKFLFDVPLVMQAAAELDESEKAAILQAAGSYDGAGWSSSRAYRKLLEVTNVPLVRSSIGDYLAAFTFALCLLWDQDLVNVDLSDQCAAAATVFAELRSAGTGAGHGDAAVTEGAPYYAEGDWEDEEEDEEVVAVEWEQAFTPLPAVLEALWRRGDQGPKADMRSVMHEVPKVSGIACRGTQE